MQKENSMVKVCFLFITIIGVVFTKTEYIFADQTSYCCTGTPQECYFCEPDGAIQGSIGTPLSRVENCSGTFKIPIGKTGGFPVTGKSDTDRQMCNGAETFPSDQVDAMWTASEGTPTGPWGPTDTFGWTAPCLTVGVTIGLTLDDHGHYKTDSNGTDSESVVVVVPTSQSATWYEHVWYQPGNKHKGDYFLMEVGPNCPCFTGVTVNEDMFYGTSTCNLTQEQGDAVCYGISEVGITNCTTVGIDEHSGPYPWPYGKPCIARCVQRWRVVCDSYSQEGNGPYYKSHVVDRNVTQSGLIYVTKDGQGGSGDP